MAKLYKVGDKIKFAESKQRFTIRACNSRYMVCTKPFNAKKTFLYTIVDLEEGIRGRDGYICTAYDYTKESEAKKYLKELASGKIEISSRHRYKLNIEYNNYGE